jgi:hypothetical protein
MFSAQIKLYAKIATSTLGVAFLLVSPSSIYAASTTTIGEFLYDDSYVPDTAATCTLNVKDTSGAALISSQSLTATADGWYGYSFTSPTTVGYYRSEICCDTTSGDHMCIDKSFNIDPEVTASTSPSTDDIASAVWGYSGRTLTSFNSLVADIWGYTTRNLTPSTTNGDLATIAKNTKETRLLIEELVNKPIIENSLEDVKDIDLGERIKQSKSISNELYINLLLLGSNVTKTNKDWNKLTDREVLDNLTDAKNMIGDESDSSSTDSFFGRINYLRDTWGLKESDDLREEIKAIKDSLSYVSSGVASYGKSKAMQKEVKSVLTYLKTSEKVLTLLNKKITETESLTTILDTNISAVDKVLGSWTSDSYLGVKESVDNLAKNIFAINKVPKGNLVIDSVYTDITGEKKLKNKVLGLRALLFANKKMLVGGQKTAFAANWLEEGSIVIKTLITNPSVLISQDVPLKYYLPKELKKENIIDSDTGIEVKYDTEKDQLYVDGTFKLKAGETRTIKVRVEDVWQINESEIESLLKQAEDLTKTLEKSSFFAQGVSLKSDITVSLSKAKEFVKDSITPESKIKSFREASLEVLSAKEKIEKLKDLVSEAQSSGSILGFVGGSQAIAVWGIVLAVVSAFVFMAVYMKKLIGAKASVQQVASSTGKTSKTNTFDGNHNVVDKMAIFIVVATISALSSSIAVKKFVIPVVVASSTRQEVLGAATPDYKHLKAVDLVSIDGVVKTYQDEGTETISELIDSGKAAVEIERGEKRVRVVVEGKEVWVLIENVMSK